MPLLCRQKAACGGFAAVILYWRIDPVPQVGINTPIQFIDNAETSSAQAMLVLYAA